MSWVAAGPDTWRIGRFTVHRASMPGPVYWLSDNGKRPERLSSKEAVIERIRERAKG